MGMTPYPNGNNDYENPSILCGDDGQTWAVPAGLTNPVEPAPANLANHNGDVDILVDGNGTMWMYFIYREPGVVQKVYVRSSTDGITWTDKVELLTGDDLLCGSPAVVYDGSQYRMWYVNEAVSPHTLKMRTCATPDGTWGAEQTCTITGLSSLKEPSHLDVYFDGSLYRAYLVIRNKDLESGFVLQSMTSANGTAWTMNPPIILMYPGTSGAWDDSFIYRTSAVKRSYGADLWYSAMKANGTWHIGFTKHYFT